MNSNSKQAQQRAEKHFKKQEHAQGDRQAMIEYKAYVSRRSRKDRTFESASISKRDASRQRIAGIDS